LLIDYKLGSFLATILIETKDDLTMQELVSLGIVRQKFVNKVTELFSGHLPSINTQP
jgi:hypothetical protein